VQQNFNDYKASMVSHFMRGTEQALSVAGVMDTTDIRVVQAFSIYLEVAGVHYGTRGVWIMTGTLARTAASMGLHRDGSNFDNISYFEAEMRRRLWWQICFLDRRIAQCDVPEMAIGSGAFDTRPPANVNDADLSPGMTHEPVSRKGFTEMSFCLAMCDLWYLGLKVHRWVPVLVNQPNKREAILATAMKVIDDARKKIQNDVITGEGPRTPIQCFVEFIVALTLNQFEIICQHTEVFLKNNRPAGTPVHPNNSFRSSVECLRQLKIWKEHPATRQWAWIFVNYHQWHAAGIIFASLAPRRWDAEAEEGWKLAMTFVRELPIVMKTKNPLRPTLLSLIAEARGQRTREFARLQREGGPSCPLTEAMNDGGQVCSMSDLLSSTRTEPMATDSHDMGCKSTNTALDINQCSDRLKVYKSSVAGTELSWENLVEGNTNSSPSGSSNIGAFTTQQDDAFFALNILGDDGAMYPKNGLDDPFLFGGETNNSGENVFVCNNGGGAGNNHLQYHDTGIDEEFLYI
jgi:hypothetical protein